MATGAVSGAGSLSAAAVVTSVRLCVGVLGRRGGAEEACLHGVALLDVSWLVYVEWICGIVSHHMAMIVTSQLWAIVGFVRRLWQVGGGGSV